MDGEAECVKRVVKEATPLIVVGLVNVQHDGDVGTDADRLEHGGGGRVKWETIIRRGRRMR
jgi:hypothetical protein